MDNLTHSLAGAILGQMGLKTKTGLAMPTLIIAANLPDIDAVAVLLGGHQHLAMRRGITHGPIAMAILPLLLWGIMLVWDKWRPSEIRLPVHKGWLLALAYIGTISHPALDWLNNYGIRLLEPFSTQWFYGDSIFIIDIWIWAALIAGVWISFRRERVGKSGWQRPAWLGSVAVAMYIFANFLITANAEKTALTMLKNRHVGESLLSDWRDGVSGLSWREFRERNPASPELLVVASPIPIAFWRRDVFWRDGLRYGRGRYQLGVGTHIDRSIGLHGGQDIRILAWRAINPDVAAYLKWARMPIVTVVREEVTIGDQRFDSHLVKDRFTVRTRTDR